jgi:hypothetical protein
MSLCIGLFLQCIQFFAEFAGCGFQIRDLRAECGKFVDRFFSCAKAFDCLDCRLGFRMRRGSFRDGFEQRNGFWIIEIAQSVDCCEAHAFPRIGEVAGEAVAYGRFLWFVSLKVRERFECEGECLGG